MTSPLAAAALAAAREGGKLLLSAPARRRGQWRGQFLCTKLPTGLWRIEQDWRDPCRLWVESVDLEYAFSGPFESDGGSIPKLFQSIKQLRLEPDSFLRPYALHDWAYARASVRCRIPPDGEWRDLPQTREDADTLLYYALCADGATLAEAEVIYDGVRVGGSHAWNQHRSRC